MLIGHPPFLVLTEGQIRALHKKDMNRVGSAFTPYCFCSTALCLTLYSATILFFFQTCFLPSLHPSLPPLAPPCIQTSPSHNSSIPPIGLPFLKIFMYNLPRKFTFGVIEAYLRSRDVQKIVSDDSKLQYPGNQHSAEWWLFLDLIKPQIERFGSPAIRVTRPEDADVFYVPFFSSLSVTVNPSSSDLIAAKTNYSDEAMQTELLQWLENQETWHRNRGRDHVVVCQDPNALHVVIDRFKDSILLLSDFGRLEPEQGSWWKDVVIPYSHRIASYVRENATLERTTLLFFMGNRYRKELVILYWPPFRVVR